MVRLSTVGLAATIPLVMPTIRKFREAHPSTQVEVFGGLHADVERALLEEAATSAW